MDGVTVRRAVPGDYRVIGRLLSELLEMHRAGRPDLFEDGAAAKSKYSEEEYLELLRDPKSVIFTACIGGETAGYLICKIIDKKENPVLKSVKTLYLDDLCVSGSERGKGAGRALMAAAEEYARKNGFHNITLNVWEFNENAKGFYAAMGYKTQRRELEKVLEQLPPTGGNG